ncbi:MAG: hypothetical protein AAGA75_21780 [Cyanobacteria bacterium P01_E01_bin.6]
MTAEDTTQQLLKQAIALFEQTSTMLDHLLGNNSSNLIDKHQAAKLLCVNEQTLKKYRADHWREGIHFFSLPGGSYRYNRMLLEDWVVNHANPQAHQTAIEYWASTLPSNQKVKSSRRKVA